MVVHKLDGGFEPEIACCFGLYSDVSPLILAAQLNLKGFFRFMREKVNPAKSTSELQMEYAVFSWDDAQNECRWRLLSNRPLVVHRLRPADRAHDQSLLFAEEKKPQTWCALKGNHDFWLWCEGELSDPKLEAQAQQALRSCAAVKTFQTLTAKEQRKLISTLPY